MRGSNDSVFFYPLLREEYHRSVPIHVTGGTSVPYLRSSLLRARVKVHRIFEIAPRFADFFQSYFHRNNVSNPFLLLLLLSARLRSFSVASTSLYIFFNRSIQA